MNNLPPFATPFVGREDELAEITRLLADPACRLLTLVGPGGMGKTRLAIEASRSLVDSPLRIRGGVSFPDSVYLTPLQPLNSPDFIVPAIADAIHFQFYPGGEPKPQLLDYLREKSLLLVLDNFEHLLDGVGIVSDMLSDAPDVKVLATSRERLNLVEEWALEVQGLPVPANEAETEIAAYGAVQLFLQNARRVQVGFALAETQKPAVSRICRLVGGMPLGIELASAWVRALSCEQIAGELERSLDILETPARNVPPRHRTMRAAFEPTWKRLSEEERGVFKRLSVFRGGFPREAAEAVAGASLRTLSALVDKSLLRVDTTGRYDVHELLRQYGEEQLEALPEESAHAHDRHCWYYAEFVGARWQEMKGPKLKAAMAAIEVELENIKTGWAWAAQHGKREQLSKSLFGLRFFYYFRNRFQDAEIALSQAIAGLESAESGNRQDELFACLLSDHASFCPLLGLDEKAQVSFQKCIHILQSYDEREMREEAAFAYGGLGQSVRQTQPHQAEQLFQKDVAICRAHGYRFTLMLANGNLANLHLFVLADHIQGKPFVEEGFEIARQFGNPWYMAFFQG